MRKHAILGILALLGILGHTLPVSACSGGPPPWNEWLPMLVRDSDVIVIGQYVKLDDAKANGILQVQTYLKGNGGEYLVIGASDVRAIENRLHVDRNYSMCGTYEPTRLEITGSYVYFLSRQNTGIHTIHHMRYFPSADATTPVWESSTDRTDLDIGDLSSQITAQVGNEPQKPNTDVPYPRTTPILLTTTNNLHFLLPVDSTDIVSVSNDEIVDLRRDQHECDTPPCIVYSPNGLDKVYLQADGDEPHDLNWFVPYVESNAVGRRIVFSATSETYALWKDDEIQLYALWYPKLGYPDDWLSSIRPVVEFFNSTPAGNSLQYPVVWSPDGRTLAFSTDEGLWLWDALNVGYPPQLLIPTDSQVPVVRYFSPRGRYLAVSEGDSRYNLDLVTEHRLPDGYLSPNDRILLVFDTAAAQPTTLEIAYLAPGIRQFEYYPKVEYLDVQWIDDTYFVAAITGTSYLKYKDDCYIDAGGNTICEGISYVVEEPFYDVVQYHSSGIGWFHELQVPYGINDVQMQTFTYKNGAGLIEISVDGYHLSINDRIISLVSELSSPIKDAVWLPSAFYFTATKSVP